MNNSKQSSCRRKFYPIIIIFTALILLSGLKHDVYALTSQAVLGEQKIAVILVNYKNTTQPALTKESAKYFILEANNYYKEVSYNKIDLNSDVYGWYQISANQSCDENITMNQAIKAADNDIYFPNYSYVIVMAPFGPNCGWKGSASTAKIKTVTGDGEAEFFRIVFNATKGTVGTLAHELGHTFGVAHSYHMFCGDLWGSNCYSGRDLFSIEGGYWEKYLGHLNAPHKERIGWLDSSSIQTVGVDGTYVLEPLETVSSGLKAIKIQRSNDSYLYIEYRRPLGYDKGIQDFWRNNTDPAYSIPYFDGDGIVIYYVTRKKNFYGYYENEDLIPTFLLVPSSSYPDQSKNGKHHNYVLKTGMDFTDSATNTKISIVSQTENAVQVKIDFGSLDLKGPQILINSPEENEIVKGYQKIEPLLSDPSGIEYVEFRLKNSENNEVFFENDDFVPFEKTLNTSVFSDGSYSIEIVAYDRSGNSSEFRRPIFIKNTGYQSVLISNPSNDSVVTEKAKIIISVPDTATILRVDFFKDSEIIPFATSASYPFDVLWDSKTVSNGAHVLKIRAYDSIANFYTSKINITVSNSVVSGDNRIENEHNVVKSKNIIIGSSFGSGPQLRFFKSSGMPAGQFFAYEKSFRGGISFVVKDLDGKKEIITAPGPDRRPEIRIFTPQGKLISSFLAYESKFKGGVNVAAGDIDGDGKKEIITSTKSGSPHVRIFGLRNGKWVSITQGFFAYQTNMKQGVNIAVGDLDGDGIDEIITTPGIGASPMLKVFGLKDGKIKPFASPVYVFEKNFTGGVNVSTSNVNGDTKAEMLVSRASDGAPQIKIFELNQSSKKITPMSAGFYAFDKSLKIGIDIASGDIDGDSKTEIFTSIASKGQPLVRIFSPDGKKMVREFKAFPQSSFPGVLVEKW